jgi:hypothetical protein
MISEYVVWNLCWRLRLHRQTSLVSVSSMQRSLSTCKLRPSLWRRIVKHQKQFQALQKLVREVSEVSIIIRELEDQAATPDSLLNLRGNSSKAELKEILNNLTACLEEFQDLVKTILKFEVNTQAHVGPYRVSSPKCPRDPIAAGLSHFCASNLPGPSRRRLFSED